jgi:hypothetical protein
MAMRITVVIIAAPTAPDADTRAGQLDTGGARWAATIAGSRQAAANARMRRSMSRPRSQLPMRWEMGCNQPERHVTERVFERGHHPTQSSVTGAPTPGLIASHRVAVHQ